MELKGYMPVKDYAEKEKLTVQAIYKAIREGRLESKKLGSYTLVKV